MISLRSKLLFYSFSILGTSALSYSITSYYSLSRLSAQSQTLNLAHSEAVKTSYETIFNNNISKIKTIYEKTLLNKGHALITQNITSLKSMIADNSFVGLKEYLQHIFEQDQDLVSATYFEKNAQGIKAWHYVSTDYPQGLRIPVNYNIHKKGWDATTLNGSQVFIPDPQVLEMIRQTKPDIKYSYLPNHPKSISKITFSLPVGEKKQIFGYLRFELTPQEMNKVVSEEETQLRSVLTNLESQNSASLKDSESLRIHAFATATFILVLGTLMITGLTYLISIIFSRRITEPLTRLSRVASEMASGHYDHAISIRTNDEIGVFAQTFNQMRTAILKRDQELASMNKNLEQIVNFRTEQLEQENKKISSLLNGMKQAVFTVLNDGTIRGPVSRHAEQVFGFPIEGKNVFEILYTSLKQNTDFYSNFKTNFALIFGETYLQWRLSEPSLPTRVYLRKSQPQSNLNQLDSNPSEQFLKINYSPLFNDQGFLESLMLVVEDITLVEHLEKQISKQNQQLELLRQITSKSPEEIRTYFTHTQQLIAQLVQEFYDTQVPYSSLQKALNFIHTIKGNSRNIGFTRISGQAHQAEDELNSIKRKVTPTDPSLPMPVLTQIRSLLDQIRISIKEYQTTSQIVCGETNLRSTSFFPKFHEILTELGWFPTRSPFHTQTNSREKIQNLLSIANELNHSGLEQACVSLLNLSDLSPNPTTSSPWIQLYAEAFQLLLQFPQPHPSLMGAGSWVFTALSLQEISKHIHSLKNRSDQEVLRQDFKHCENASRGFQALHLHDWSSYFKALLKLLETYLTTEDPQLLEQVSRCETQLWNRLFLVTQFQFQQLPIEQQSWIQNYLSQLLIGDLELIPSIPSRLQNNGLLLFTRTLNQLPGQAQSFLTLWSDRRGQSPEELVQNLFTKPFELEEPVQLLFQTIRSPNESRTEWISAVFQWSLLQNGYLDALLCLHFALETIVDPSVNPGRYKHLEIRDRNLNHWLDELIPTIRTEDDLHQFFEGFSTLFDLPLMPTLWSLKKSVLQMAETQNKPLEFSVFGDEILLPQSTHQSIIDCVMHLVNNALDHGLEIQEERTSKGKTPMNHISIHCFNQNDYFLIRVQDDGRGIDSKKVAAKAVIQGILTAESLEQLSLEDQLQLIFVPGMTTRDQVTELSGRGVGLDAVKRTVESFHGTIHVETDLDRGTRIEMKFPRC